METEREGTWCMRTRGSGSSSSFCPCATRGCGGAEIEVHNPQQKNSLVRPVRREKEHPRKNSYPLAPKLFLIARGGQAPRLPSAPADPRL